MFSVGHIPLVHSPILYILCTISILGSLKISTHNVTDEKNSSSIAVFGVKKLVLQIELSRKKIVFELYGIFRRSEISFFRNRRIFLLHVSIFGELYLCRPNFVSEQDHVHTISWVGNCTLTRSSRSIGITTDLGETASDRPCTWDKMKASFSDETTFPIKRCPR